MAVCAGEHENAGFNFLISTGCSSWRVIRQDGIPLPQTLHLPASLSNPLSLSLSLHVFVCPPLNLHLALLNCFKCLSGQKEEEKGVWCRLALALLSQLHFSLQLQLKLLCAFFSFHWLKPPNGFGLDVPKDWGVEVEKRQGKASAAAEGAIHAQFP